MPDSLPGPIAGHHGLLVRPDHIIALAIPPGRQPAIDQIAHALGTSPHERVT